MATAVNPIFWCTASVYDHRDDFVVLRIDQFDARVSAEESVIALLHRMSEDQTDQLITDLTAARNKVFGTGG